MGNETPFQIKISPEQRKKLARDLENVNNLKSAIHFIKNYKHCIIVNKKFKRKVVKFSLKTVAGLSVLVMAMSLIKQKNNLDNGKNDISPVKTNLENTIEITPTTYEENNTILTPALVYETNVDLDLSNIAENIGENINYEYDIPSLCIAYPKAWNTNEDSDYTNYYKVKEKYGDYIEYLSRESGVDSRLIIAMIAQENPNGIDETYLGTYGPMCVTSIHDGETYNYYHYNDDGEYVNEPITIDIDNIKPTYYNNELYENGKYGDITIAEATCIKYGVVITKDNFYQVNKTNDLTREENVPLAILAYNHGYPDIIHCTRYSSTLYDACYSVRYTHAGDVSYDDDQYLEHVLNKIPDEELVKPFTFIDNDENKLCFTLEKDNELANTGSKEIEKSYAL